MDNKMIIAVRFPRGSKRMEVKATDKIETLYANVSKLTGLNQEEFCLYKQGNSGLSAIKSSLTRSISSVGIQQGDSLVVRPLGTANKSQSSIQFVQEDALDVELAKEDGRIFRKKDPKYCQHPSNAQCVHCAPLQPFDSEYLASLEPPVKYLSFHAYLRKIEAGRYSGALSNISCKKKPDCKNHKSDAICSACMPDPLTLELQSYRHVDYVQFEHPSILDRFVNFWRSSGHQRIGFLIGKYEKHPAISLGIKAVVAAIYEPPQETHKNWVSLLDPDPHIEKVTQLAESLDMRIIGWIFTDLLASGENGKVRFYRGTADTFFLSAEEAITAGYFQNKYPNICSKADGGQFGSKFVSCVLTADISNQIAPHAYQLSNQGMALVRDEVLVPTFDAPELAWCRESSSDGSTAPDVFYSTTNEYGSHVKNLARPLPMAVLLTDMAVGVAKDPSEHICTFSTKSTFPIENRVAIGEVQDSSALKAALNFGSPGTGSLLRAFSDFHFLLYLLLEPHLKFTVEEILPLCRAILSNDADACMQWTEDSVHWPLVLEMISSQGTGAWQCKHCTYSNPSSDLASCEMCGLPR